MDTALTAVEIFCSYAHEDDIWRQKLATHLSLLRRQGLISLWHDRLITPGTDWAKTIDTHLETASVILLLVSADFFASDYCYGIEMQRAIARQEAGEVLVIPILVRPVDWNNAPVAHLHALPTDARPLSAWQDEDMALTDVVAGIRRVVEDMPLLAASAPRAALPAIWNIPYPRNPFFLGREHELAQVRQRLQAGQATALSQPQAISGLGGIGKTQLALEYAYRYRAEYQAVLWLRAETAEVLTTSYTRIARILDLPQKDAQEQEVIVQAVKKWLVETSGWLLILDNADELNMVQSFLPPVQRGHLLLTTRAQITGKIALRFEVEPLDARTGALLVLRRAGVIAVDASFDVASEADQSLALVLAQEMGGLPLALDQAGAYIEETQCGLADYLQQYQTRGASLLAQRGRLADDHPEPVATTWSLSFAQVEAASSLAAALLRACAFLAPDAIPEELLADVLKMPLSSSKQWGELASWFSWFPFRFLHKRPSLVKSGDGLNEAMAILRAYSLIQRHPSEKVVSVHRLIQAIVRDALEDQEQINWITRIVAAVNKLFPSGDFESWGQCARYLPQALACARWITQRNLTLLEGASLLNRTGQYLNNRANYTDAEQLYQQALLIRTQRLGVTHPHTGNVLNNLAVLYDTQRRYSEAEPLYQQSLAIYQQQLGATHPNTASSLNNLAALYLQQEKYEQAEPLLKRALMIREQQLGLTHPDVARSLSNLALLELRQGNDDVAEMLWQRALAIYEQQAGSTQPDIGRSLNNLALLYWSQGRYREAEPLLNRAVSISEQQLGVEHPDTMLMRKHYLSLTQLVQQEQDGMKVRDELW